jgi:hypothetical protein
MRNTICMIGLLVYLLTGWPGFAEAKKKHPTVPLERECSECHVQQQQSWQGGAHGLMGVKCVVCHGSLETSFARDPGVTKCRGCHAEKIDTVKKPAEKDKKCSLCHDSHTVMLKASGIDKAGFHRQGGKQ